MRLRDGHQIFYRVWNAEQPIATVHINHGMAEHSARYDELAHRLVREGFTVFCQDHRGHGRTAEEGELGWFAEQDGWAIVSEDSYELDQLIEKRYPNIPHLIFGHSMGSFIARTNVSLHSDSYSAAIFCGTGSDQGLVGRFVRSVAKRNEKKYGNRHKDQVLSMLLEDEYNKQFKGDGELGWLSSDRTEVNRYKEDELCGFVCTSSFYKDLITGSFTANDKNLIKGIRKDLPILFISGEHDPVGPKEKGVNKAAALYRAAGIKDVRVKIFKNGRHEILNDAMRESVMDTIVDFYKEAISE